MKKILSTLCGITCITALLLGCAETADGSCNLLWTLGCLAVAVISGRLMLRLNPEIKEEEV